MEKLYSTISKLALDRLKFYSSSRLYRNSFKLFQHYKYNKFIECPDEAVVTEKLIDHYFLSRLSPVKPRRTIKLQPINHAANKQSTNRYKTYK